MNTVSQNPRDSPETRIQNALLAHKSGKYRSVRAAAIAFSIPPSTLSYRIAGRASRSQAHESAQILSCAEEKTLVRWLTRLTSTGFDQGCRIDSKRARDDTPATDRNTRASLYPSEKKKRQKNLVEGQICVQH